MKNAKYWVLNLLLICGVFGVAVATNYSLTAEAANLPLPAGTYRFKQDPPSTLTWDSVVPASGEIPNWPYPSPGGVTYPWDSTRKAYEIINNTNNPPTVWRIVITGGRWHYYVGSTLLASGTVALIPPVPPVPPS